MAIEYPLILPTTPGLSSVEFHMGPLAGMTASPFTGQPQIFEWQREWWEAVCALPPMARAAAEDWLAALAPLSSRGGTFLLGDPGGKTPRGTGAGYPSVDGADQLGKTLATLGWTGLSTGVLKKGDCLQIVKNYEPYPRAFDNAHWTKNQCTVAANTVVAPNGVTEAERATPTSGATNAYIYASEQTYPPRYKGLTWQFSVWLKAATGTPSIIIFLYDGVGSNPVTCNLTTTWQRFVVNRAVASNATVLQPFIGANNSWPEADGPIDMWGAAVYCPTLDARLHKNLTEVTTPAEGQASLDLWPRLRESPPDFSALILTDAKGTFRLREAQKWNLDDLLHYGMGFSAVEAF
jgi:hypothetical protein